MTAARRSVAALVILGLTASSLGLAPRARAEDAIEVRVVDVAGGRVYVSPGLSGGVRPRAEVRLGGRTYRIEAATASYAVFDADGRAPALGATGAAERLTGDEASAGPEPLPSPRPLAAYRGQWRAPVLPASTQHPDPVPLGITSGARPVTAVLGATVAGVLTPEDPSRSFARGVLRGRLHAASATRIPMTLDADAAVQLWLGGDLDQRAGSDSRPWVYVRQLEGAIGDERRLYAALGRLRYAATQLGMLDGVRVSAGTPSGVAVAAFGGAVPDPTHSAPSLDVARFGLEATYEAPELALRPMLSLTGYGSSYAGALDERRAQAAFHVFPESARVGGHLEVAVHDADNPWKAPRAEVSQAGVDGSFRFGLVELGGRVDYRTPERSRWLADRLPVGWLCRSLPPSDPASDAPECDGRYDGRLLGAVDVGVVTPRARASASGTIMHVGQEGLVQVGAFVGGSLLRLFEIAHVDLGASAATSPVVDSYGARVGGGVSLLGRRLDLGAHYRLTFDFYPVDVDPFVQHLVGASAVLLATSELSFALTGDASAGEQPDVVLVALDVVYRPRIGKRRR